MCPDEIKNSSKNDKTQKKSRREQPLMALFLKAAAGILLTVILLAQLRQKELSVFCST